MSKTQPKTRSWIAVDAHFRKAGAMGGSARTKNRRNRQSTKRDLRNER